MRSLVSLAALVLLSACGDGMSADGQQPRKARPGNAAAVTPEHCEQLPEGTACDALEVCCAGESCTLYSAGDAYTCVGVSECDQAAQQWAAEHCG